MRSALSLLIVVPATLAACDAVARGMLGWVARRREAPRYDRDLGRTLVVVPARSEGERLDATLASLTASSADVLLVLDGGETATQTRAEQLGARVVVKTPPGPSKAAALAWLATTHRELIASYDTVLILDAGSRLEPGFFDRLAWPGDAAAAQTYLSGTAIGVGAAAAASETIAQNGEDRGREALGWNVRLRGTGTAFRSTTFLELMPRLDTRVEDLEATLLLSAAGQPTRMFAPQAVVHDDKPHAVTAAASQRARWLLGRYELLVRRAPAFARLIARRPAEGLAFFVEIFGRPLSLTAPLRVAAAVLLFGRGQPALAVTMAATVAMDVATHASAHRSARVAIVRLAGSWMLALLLAPRALVKWMRA